MESEVYPNAAATDRDLTEEQPPSYESAVAAQPPAEAPPTYQSLFGDLQRTRKESKGVIDFLKKLAILFFSTVGFLVVLACFLAIPITCLVLGVIFRDKCKIQSKIPIYLIVFGIFGILRNILCMVDRSQDRMRGDEASATGDESGKCKSCSSLIDLFLFIWFICGNIWVYGTSEPDFDQPNSSVYCNKTVFLFAFWLNTSLYILFGAFCACCCFLGCCIAVFSDSNE